MFSFGSTYRLNIQSKLRKVKGLDKNSKDKRSTKRYKQRVKANKEQILDQVTISIVYKPKAQKVRPINKNNSTRGILREKLDQYKYLFTRDTSQEYTNQFKDYLLP